MMQKMILSLIILLSAASCTEKRSSGGGGAQTKLCSERKPEDCEQVIAGDANRCYLDASRQTCTSSPPTSYYPNASGGSTTCSNNYQEYNCTSNSNCYWTGTSCVDKSGISNQANPVCTQATTSAACPTTSCCWNFTSNVCATLNTLEAQGCVNGGIGNSGLYPPGYNPLNPNGGVGDIKSILKVAAGLGALQGAIKGMQSGGGIIAGAASGALSGVMGALGNGILNNGGLNSINNGVNPNPTCQNINAQNIATAQKQQACVSAGCTWNGYSCQ